MTTGPDPSPAAAAWDAEYAAAADVWPAHQVTERYADGSFTVQYLAGPIPPHTARVGMRGRCAPRFRPGPLLPALTRSRHAASYAGQ